MAWNPEINTPPPSECVGVMQLVNSFIAIHRKGNQTQFISKNPAVDIQVAVAQAKAFGIAHHIAFHDTLLINSKPIITVVKKGEEWCPAEFHHDKIRLLSSLGSLKFSGTQQEAINLSQVIALSQGADCLPFIGISLEGQLPF